MDAVCLSSLHVSVDPFLKSIHDPYHFGLYMLTSVIFSRHFLTYVTDTMLTGSQLWRATIKTRLVHRDTKRHSESLRVQVKGARRNGRHLLTSIHRQTPRQTDRQTGPPSMVHKRYLRTSGAAV
mmetsp:Transcript_34496/g.99334  ORF Transcript_34496/g.99334 Transcript_34496/m.99334 type:complete len:124 (+) Transcript_34496:452-823(+)